MSRSKSVCIVAAEMRDQGISVTEIAQRLGLPSRKRVYEYVWRGRNYSRELERYRRGRLPPKPETIAARAVIAARNKEIVRLYHEVGQAETARILGISRNVVAGVMSRWRKAEAA